MHILEQVSFEMLRNDLERFAVGYNFPTRDLVEFPVWIANKL